MNEPFRLVIPAPAYLDSYRVALEEGWSPSVIDATLHRQRELDRLDRDAMAFLMSLDDPHARGDPITLPDGSTRPRLPGFRRWMWDGQFCGHIAFHWQPGTSELPPYLLGHIGFSVVPWKQGHGYAARAIVALLPEARRCGLTYLEVATLSDNPASQRTIERAGGVLVERLAEHVFHDGAEVLRYRIAL